MKAEDTLIDYIKKERSKGFSDEEIKQQLVKFDHSPEAISAAFPGLEGKQAKPQIKMYLIIVLFLIILVAGFIVFDPIKKVSELSERYWVKTAEPTQEAQTQEPSIEVYKEQVKSYVNDNDEDFWGCMSHSLEDASYCDKLDGTSRSDCLTRFNLFRAIEKSDLNYCDDILDENTKIGCRAVIQSDLNLCSGISDQATLSLCEEIIGLLNAGTPSTEGKNEVSLEFYYIIKAIRTEDGSYCDKISYKDSKETEILRNECHAIISKDISHCENILVLFIDDACNEFVPGSLKADCLSELKEEIKSNLLAS